MKGVLVSSLAVVLTAGALAQQPPVTRTTTTGVVIDVTVVDRDGRPILDLRPDEFELSEDGKRQLILSASLVHAGAVRRLDGTAAPGSGGSGTQPAPTAATPSASDSGAALPDKTPSVTAILFDRLSPEMRPLAHKAALAYLSTLSPPHDYAGVFLADVKLATFAGFTSQGEVLRTALDRLASTAPTNTSLHAERSSYPRVQNLPLDPNQPATTGAEAGAGWVNPLEREKYLPKSGAGDPSEMYFRQMELRMFETYTQFLAQFEGQASLAGLRSVVDSMALLPGRKSVLYFCEQLQVSDRVKPKFDALIHEANRANISFYPVDAAGLRVHSEEAKVGRHVDLAGTQGVGDARRGDGAWTKDLEKQEQILTSRAGAVLGRLAKETGGFLLENTNDLAAGVARMQLERTSYYLLGYQPLNTAPDGKFRRVTVKVRRPRVTVRARPGYVAARQP
jgi:VWFA-related protein